MKNLTELKLAIYESETNGIITKSVRDEMFRLLEDTEDKGIILSTVSDYTEKTITMSDPKKSRCVVIVKEREYREPYFKLYDGKTKNTSKNVIRLCFNTPKFIIHKNNEYKIKTWEINKNELEDIENMLLSPYIGIPLKGVTQQLTNFQVMILYVNEIYNNIPYDKSVLIRKYNVHDGVIPIDASLPKYSKNITKQDIINEKRKSGIK